MRAGRTENLLLMVLGYMTQQQLATSKCPVFKSIVIPVWARLAGVEWFEVLNYPGPLKNCVVRKYHPFNETMDWIEKDSPIGKDIRKKTFDFILENGQEFLNKERTFFQQVLDSDLATWVLLHICSEGDKKSKFTLTLREPLSVIPADIERQVSQTLRLAGIEQEIEWTRSPCMLDRTITSIFLQPAVTLYPPPDAVVPYDPTGAVELPSETERPPDAGPPQETKQAQESDTPEQTELPLDGGLPEENGVPQYGSMPPDTSIAPETMFSDTNTSSEIKMTPETSIASETIMALNASTGPEFNVDPDSSGAAEINISLDTSTAPEINMTPERSVVPETNLTTSSSMAQESSTAPEINLAADTSKAQDTEKSEEVSLSPETETAAELILVPITTPPWHLYYNDEESW